MKKYFLSYLAEQNAEEIVANIAQENPDATLKFLDTLYEAMGLLATHPQMGHRKERFNSSPSPLDVRQGKLTPNKASFVL